MLSRNESKTIPRAKVIPLPVCKSDERLNSRHGACDEIISEQIVVILKDFLLSLREAAVK